MHNYWLRACYGKQASTRHLPALQGKPIACSGSIFGSPLGFAALARAFQDHTCRSSRDGIDQAVGLAQWRLTVP